MAIRFTIGSETDSHIDSNKSLYLEPINIVEIKSHLNNVILFVVYGLAFMILLLRPDPNGTRKLIQKLVCYTL